MAAITLTGEALWERMNRAVEKVQQRLERAASALGRAEIPYAVSGGNAVRAWVAQADEAAVRNTRDVDILLRREDLPAAIEVLENEGFVYRHVKSIDMFLDGPDAKTRDAVHIVFAKEKVREQYAAAPDVDEVEQVDNFSVLSLEALVRMELTAFRSENRMHLIDMIDVELIDGSWCGRFPNELARRLQELIDNPEG